MNRGDMRYWWKSRRRNLQAALIHALHGRSHADAIGQTLGLLAPWRTEHPLIRLGGTSNSAYLLPDDLEGIAASFSPGVGQAMGLDLDIMARGIPTFLADASVDGLPAEHPLAHFDRLFIGPRTGARFVTLDDWIGRNAPSEGDLLLQMDIEGAEWAALDVTRTETLARCRIILIELHQLQRIFLPRVHALYHRALEKLTRNHAVVHIHPNNAAAPVRAGGFCIPPVIEVTLLRRDRFRQAEPETRFPHPLDRTTTTLRPDYPLPRFWDNRDN